MHPVKNQKENISSKITTNHIPPTNTRATKSNNFVTIHCDIKFIRHRNGSITIKPTKALRPNLQSAIKVYDTFCREIERESNTRRVEEI